MEKAVVSIRPDCLKKLKYSIINKNYIPFDETYKPTRNISNLVIVDKIELYGNIWYKVKLDDSSLDLVEEDHGYILSNIEGYKLQFIEEITHPILTCSKFKSNEDYQESDFRKESLRLRLAENILTSSSPNSFCEENYTFLGVEKPYCCHKDFYKYNPNKNSKSLGNTERNSIRGSLDESKYQKEKTLKKIHIPNNPYLINYDINNFYEWKKLYVGK